MKHTIYRWTALFLCALMLIPSFVSTADAAAETITDAGWTRLIGTPNSLGCTATQGMGVGEKYLYSIKPYYMRTIPGPCVDMSSM